MQSCIENSLIEASRILVTGITSIHGWPVFTKLRELLPEHRLFGVKPPKATAPNADNVLSTCITNRLKLQEIRDIFKPTHIIHCAGVCDLDVCESRPDWARLINVQGAKSVVELFGNDIQVLYISSDLVFSGHNPPSGGYSEEDPLSPVSVAGQTFAEAEEQIKRCKDHCIIRLGLPLGNSMNGHKGAIDWINSRFSRNLPVTLFYDEYRSCASCDEIGDMVVAALKFKLRGIFHFGGDKTWSLYEIGEHVLQNGGYSPDLLKGRMRHEEKDGPPRVGNISLNSNRFRDLVDWKVT